MNFAYQFQFILLITFSFSATLKKDLDDHLEDFLGRVLAETGEEFEHLLAIYSEKEEFWAAITYFCTAEFRHVFHELVSLQEFKAIIAFLDSANMKVVNVIEEIKDILEYSRKSNNTHHETQIKGDLSAFLGDCANLFKKVNLTQLYEEKKQQDEDFRHMTHKFETRKWRDLSSALLEKETVKKSIRKLEQHGIDLRLIFDGVKKITLNVF